jgi:hypothetical protein
MRLAFEHKEKPPSWRLSFNPDFKLNERTERIITPNKQAT